MWDSVSTVCVHESMSVDTHDAGVSVVFTSVRVNACGTSDTGSGHVAGMNAHMTFQHLTPRVHMQNVHRCTHIQAFVFKVRVSLE